MSDYSELVAAIYRLTKVIINSLPTLFSKFIYAFIPIACTIISETLFEIIKKHINTSYINASGSGFKKIQKEVAASLILYSRYYMNPIDIAHSGKDEIELYDRAANSMRTLSVKLTTLSNSIQGHSCCGVPQANITKAASSLMGLSNSFFTPYNCPDLTKHEYNERRRNDIRALLKIK